jgi:hypothetical protein
MNNPRANRGLDGLKMNVFDGGSKLLLYCTFQVNILIDEAHGTSVLCATDLQTVILLFVFFTFEVNNIFTSQFKCYKVKSVFTNFKQNSLNNIKVHGSTFDPHCSNIILVIRSMHAATPLSSSTRRYANQPFRLRNYVV